MATDQQQTVAPARKPIPLSAANEAYLNKVKSELEAADPASVAAKFLTTEVDRVERGYHRDWHWDVVSPKNVKVSAKVQVPTDNAKVNYIGKILGPKGNTLKRLQDETQTRIYILGKGSMRDESKEKELYDSGDILYSHFKEDLHVKVEALAPVVEAYRRVAFCMNELRKFMLPEFQEEIRQSQMRELDYMKGGPAAGGGGSYEPRGGGRGAPRGAGRGRGGYDRGGGRGAMRGAARPHYSAELDYGEEKYGGGPSRGPAAHYDYSADPYGAEDFEGYAPPPPARGGYGKMPSRGMKREYQPY